MHPAIVTTVPSTWLEHGGWNPERAFSLTCHLYGVENLSNDRRQSEFPLRFLTTNDARSYSAFGERYPANLQLRRTGARRPHADGSDPGPIRRAHGSDATHRASLGDGPVPPARACAGAAASAGRGGFESGSRRSFRGRTLPAGIPRPSGFRWRPCRGPAGCRSPSPGPRSPVQRGIRERDRTYRPASTPANCGLRANAAAP